MARIALAVALIAMYAGYSFYIPSSVEVADIASSRADVNLLKVTLHNPTFKFVTGTLLSIETEVDIPRVGGGSAVLGSVAQAYPFTIFPQASVELDIAMNFRVLPGVDYDITLQIDGVGQRTITVTLPKS